MAKEMGDRVFLTRGIYEMSSGRAQFELCFKGRGLKGGLGRYRRAVEDFSE